MCEPGNGSIYVKCRDRIRNILGGAASNIEMRKVIDEYDGCVHKNAAKKWQEKEEALEAEERELMVAN